MMGRDETQETPTSDGTTVCFVDTNIFLECQFFTDVNWPQLLQVKSVLLIVPTTVTSELDRKKFLAQGDRQGERARKVISKLKELTAGQPHDVVVRDHVLLRLLTVEPEVFRFLGLDPGIADDRIIASALQYLKDTGTPPLLLSVDFGMLVKARARGLVAPEVVDGLVLRSEPNPDAKEIQRLKTEIAQRQIREPKLSVSFVEDNTVKTVMVLGRKVMRKPLPADYERQLAIYAQELEVNLEHVRPMRRTDSPALAEYKSAVQRHLESYRRYLEEAFIYQDERLHTEHVILGVIVVPFVNTEKRGVLR